MTDRPVLAAFAWPSNAELIEDVARLGYLRPTDRVLDPTYGNGRWWTRWRPDDLVISDRYKGPVRDDFRNLPHADGSFDVVAYDPPYVCPGGRKTSNIKDMHAAYGMDGEDFRTPAELQEIMHAGLTEVRRVVRPGGLILAKCKDYVWSGKLWAGTSLLLDHALSIDLVVLDRLEHIGVPGPQSQTRQIHARRNLSTLFVFKRPVSNSEATIRNQQKKRRILQAIKLERGCADCGYNAHAEALDFDHRPGEIKEISIGREVSNVGIDRLLVEIEKCDVVCANCHRVRTVARDQHRPDRKPVSQLALEDR